MKLKVLEDNNTFIDKYYLGEPAVSYYIEDEDVKILFDTGYSDAFIKNARSMNINLKEINKIVISHGHNDHTGGLKYLFENINNKNIELIAHTECFNKKVCENEYIGTSMTKEELEQVCNLKLTKNPLKISDNITFQYFKEINPELLYPCHCISLDAKIEMGKELKINEVGVGLEISID